MSSNFHQTNKEKEKNIIESAAMLIKCDTMLLPSNKEEEFTLLTDFSSEEEMLPFIPDNVRTH